jgi:hypothetical protein
MTNGPALTMVTSAPLVPPVVQIDGVCELKVTAKPEFDAVVLVTWATSVAAGFPKLL